MGELKQLLAIFILLLNIASYFMVGYDKRRAIKNKWRVPEKRFFTIALLGGAIGIYIGMKNFRHKTQHIQFIFGIPLIVMLNLVIFYFLFIF